MVPYLAAYRGRDIVRYCVTSRFEDCEDTIARGQLASYGSTSVILVPLIKREKVQLSHAQNACGRGATALAVFSRIIITNTHIPMKN